MSFLQIISAKICTPISFIRVRYFLTTHYFYSIILSSFVYSIITKLVIILFHSVRFIFFLRCCCPKHPSVSPFLRILWHTTTHHSQQDSSVRVIISSQRPLPDNTQHSQQTHIHSPGGIQTHNLSRPAAADLRLRPRGHWDGPAVLFILLHLRPKIRLVTLFFCKYTF